MLRARGSILGLTVHSRTGPLGSVGNGLFGSVEHRDSVEHREM